MVQWGEREEEIERERERERGCLSLFPFIFFIFLIFCFIFLFIDLFIYFMILIFKNSQKNPKNNNFLIEINLFSKIHDKINFTNIFLLIKAF